MILTEIVNLEEILVLWIGMEQIRRHLGFELCKLALTPKADSSITIPFDNEDHTPSQAARQLGFFGFV